MGSKSVCICWFLLIALVLADLQHPFVGSHALRIRTRHRRHDLMTQSSSQRSSQHWISDPSRSGTERRRRNMIMTSANGTGSSSRQEVEALTAFKEAVTGDPQGALKSWAANDSSPCGWDGIQCSPSSKVTSLNLSSLNLVGSISTQLSNLHSLQHLDLSDNSFSGSIPESLSNCSNLSFLNVSTNELTGEIPLQLGNLLSLQTLDLSFNNLTGEIPGSLGNCSMLKHLSLSINSLVGSIPPSLGSLSNLGRLWLASNALSGSLPKSLANCSSLTDLDVDSNPELGGELPSELSQLTGMRSFQVWGCNFQGQFPSWVMNFTSLVELRLDYNKLFGQIPESEIGLLSEQLSILALGGNEFTGIIPKAVTNYSALTVLSLEQNQLTGTIPPEFGLLKGLEELLLADNNISGVLPSSIANCSDLQLLYVGYNPFDPQPFPQWITSFLGLVDLFVDNMGLTGEIPESIGQLGQLQFLVFAGNDIGGELPRSMGNLTSLRYMQIGNNQLVGEIPGEIGRLQNLKRLDLQNNFFVGSFPAFATNLTQLVELVIFGNLLGGKLEEGFGRWVSQEMRTLAVADNNFSGPIPEEIGNWSNLNVLFLEGNKLSGSIPRSLGNLSALFQLALGRNQLEGGIPIEIMNCVQLKNLDLSFNRLQGGLPWEVGQLWDVEQLYLQNNFLTGPLPTSIANLTSTLQLDLSHNNFSGGIPGVALSSLWSSLIYLDLSSNLLLGPWPSEMSKLTNLQHLDMSANNISGYLLPGLGSCVGLLYLDVSLNSFTGTIPQDLGSLRQLEFFNASFNDFEGPIPDSGLFQRNITKDSFLGNPLLCGVMVLQDQPCAAATPAPSQEEARLRCRGSKCRHISILVACSVVGAFVLFGAMPLLFWGIAQCIRDPGDKKGGHMMMVRFSSKVKVRESDVEGIIHGGRENVIGMGAKSIVYKGRLQEGETVAIKVLRNLEIDSEHDSDSSGNKDALFKEVHTLAKLRHVNIIKVWGFCSSSSVKALVLEYMPRGSLHDLLYDKEMCEASYEKRFQVIMGVAQAMVYLHHDFHEPIIHRDLKPSNILLGLDLEPKLGDFGISKFTNPTREGELEATASSFCGTFGYIPPEYAQVTTISTKGDVYSFGVVLLELLTRRKPASTENFSPNQDFVNWVMEYFQEKPLELLDATLMEEARANSGMKDQIMLLFRVGLLCTRAAPQSRPSMNDVLGMLKQIKDLGSQGTTLRSVAELANEMSIWSPQTSDANDSSSF